MTSTTFFRTLCCFAALTLGIIESYSQNEIRANSTISDVTVFLSGAQVQRSANVSLKAGENVVSIGGLTQYVDGNSVQVDGSQAFMIKGVKHQLNYLNEVDVSPEIQAKKDSLEELEFTLTMRNALEQVYLEEKQMVLANRSVKGTDAVLLAEDIEEVADFFRNRLKEVEYKLIDIRNEKQDIQASINRIRNYLNNHSAKHNKVNSEIMVTLLCDKAVNTYLKVNYIVQQAGWSPVYDIRAKGTSEPVELRYKANVWQGTGNDWDDVKLTLSTGNPTVGGQAPELVTWWLNVQEKQNYRSRNLGEQNAKSFGYAPAEGAYEDADMGEAVFYMDAEVAPVAMIESLINTEFRIAIPHDIPSDFQQHEVETQRITLQASYEHLAIPKRDKDAFLTVLVTDWQKHNLLPGESNIYYEGTFVGTSFIDPAIAEDTLLLSLGRDKSLVVKREQIDEFCKTSTFGGKKRSEKAYRITVHNTKSQNVQLTLKDQLPKSSDNDVEVEILEISGASHDEETGELIWEVNLAPGDIKEVVIRFGVKYPKKKVVTNL